MEKETTAVRGARGDTSLFPVVPSKVPMCRGTPVGLRAFSGRHRRSSATFSPDLTRSGTESGRRLRPSLPATLPIVAYVPHLLPALIGWVSLLVKGSPFALSFG